MKPADVQLEYELFPFSAFEKTVPGQKTLIVKNEFVCLTRDIPEGSPPDYFQREAGRLAYAAAVYSRASRTKGIPTE